MWYSYTISYYSWKAKLILVFLLSFATASRARTADVPIKDSVATITVIGSADQIIKQINLSSFRFLKVPDNRINFGITGNKYYCIVLKIHSGTNHEGQYLSIDNTSLDTVSIFRIHDDGSSQLLYQGGSRVAYKNNRNYVWHIAPIKINKIPSFYLIALKASQKNINVGYEIISEVDLQRKYLANERLVFFYTGIIAMITAIIILAFFLFKFFAVFSVYSTNLYFTTTINSASFTLSAAAIDKLGKISISISKFSRYTISNYLFSKDLLEVSHQY